MSSTAVRPARATTVEGTRSASGGPIALPVALTLVLGALAWLPSLRQNPRLFWSLEGASAVLLVSLLALRIHSRHRTLEFEVVLRAQHYLQACAQATVLLYWGWYWRPVYEAAPLIAAQLLFAYVVDMLIAWWRRDDYTLGFAPFPVIFSINLFLWFKADWFYLQFVMIAVGFLAKECIRWDKGGRRAHIFNPSSFPLAVFSLGLILTGTTAWTWGPEIARTQFNPPNIYVLLFLIGLPGQLLFGVTTMTMSAVVTTYAFGVVYYWATGTYFFIDSYIPVAVFLGMHLLFTDPSTAPRTELGRIIFGVTYGLANVILYDLLGRAGIPTFYDKLLPVPLMNLSIKLIDRIASAGWLKRFDPARIGRSLAPRRRNLTYITIWSAVFIGLSTVDGVGDNHPGHRVPFWQHACQQNAPNACKNLALILDTYCGDGSGWACNEVAMLRWHRRVDGADRLAADFERGCALGFGRSCQNVQVLKSRVSPPTQAPPRLEDYPVILRVGKGALPDRTPVELLTRACDQGWLSGCGDLGVFYVRGDGIPRDVPRAAVAFDKACSRGLAVACSNLGYMHYNADGVPRDEAKGLAYLKQACDLGYTSACRWMTDIKR